ncbi:MAG: hypothetical protein KDD84_23225, partial [Caldilineaceae bacterium]|nr:hypothetical protein [Caldilineaceae bacterium]
TVPAGWALSAASCSDGSNPAGINLAAGKDITCTFENTRLDTIIVRVRTLGGDTSFKVTSPQLGDNDLSTSGGAAQQVFDNLTATRYGINGVAPAGWALTNPDPTCSNGDPASAINLVAGETVICEFIVQPQDAIVVEKTAVGGDGVFAFTSPQLGNFGLTTSQGSARTTFSNLTPGTFAISETVPAGWALTSASCTDGSNVGSVSLDAGETVTCRFVNTKPARLTVVQQTRSGDGVFTFRSTSLGDFVLTTANGAAQQRFDNLQPGAYTITEAPARLWQTVSATCDNGDTPDSLTLNAGDDVTCVFENRQRSLTLYLPLIFKQVPYMIYATGFTNGAGNEWSTPGRVVTAPNGERHLGEFSNEATTLTLTNLPSHRRVTVSVDLYIIRSWDGNQVDLPAARELREILEPAAVDGTVGPDRWLMKQSGQTLLHTSFTNIDRFMQSYPAAFGTADNPAQTGSTAVNSLGYTYQNIPMDSTYRIVQSFAHSGSSLELSFEALGLQIPEDESWGIDNVTVTIQ